MTEAAKLSIRKLRTELAFLYGDSRHGGPDHAEAMKAIQVQIDELEQNGHIPDIDHN